MSHVQYLDELIREYLLFRGFTNTLKSLDAELKVDKDKGFRVDKVVEQILHYISTYDLVSLRELWAHLDQRMFTKLENDFAPGIKKLESSLFKLYLVNAVTNNKPEKVNDFFTKMTPEIQGQPDWKDWFALPYIKNPEDVPTFIVYFSKHWQDTLIVSLHNFLSLLYQAMPLPVLSSYEEDANRLRRLQEENETLKHKLTTLSQCTNAIIPDTAVPPVEIMDDFYIIAQENPSNSDNQGKSIKNLIRTIGGGMPSSPVASRKHAPQEESMASHKHLTKVQRAAQPGWMKHASGDSVPKRSLSLDSRRRCRDASVENIEKKNLNKKDNFLLLSQEKMSEHKGAVTQCRFSSTGSVVASCDVEGVLKVWSSAPTPKVLSTAHLSSGLTCLDWVGKNERFVVVGGRDGVVKLHDCKENETVWETSKENGPLSDSKILSVCCSPSESSIVCTTLANNGKTGNLCLIDIKTGHIEQSVNLGSSEGNPGLHSNCCVFNHNGSLVICGCSDGSVRTLDLRYSECLELWEAHTGPVTAIHMTADHNTCFTMGTDHKLCRHNMAQNGDPTWTASLPKCHTNHGTQGFALHQSGTHTLTVCGHSPPNIYQMSIGGLVPMLSLGGHKNPVVACDWASANQCSTCISASKDGKIKISTILTP